MRALQAQVAAVWQATVETDTRLIPGGLVETEAETVAIAVAYACIATRVLDRHVFNDEYPRSGKTYRSSKYERFRDSDDQGRVLSGLALIRNSEIHLPILIDPDVDRVLGIPGTNPTVFRVFPRWRLRAAPPWERPALVKLLFGAEATSQGWLQAWAL